MAEKIKLNKNTLRDQKQMLAMYLEFLPTLELRKQQLQTELRKLNDVILGKAQELVDLLQGAAPWSPMIEKALPWVKPLVVVEEVVVTSSNIAGVKVPKFQEVRFEPVHYSLIATPALYDAAIEYFQRAISAREELAVLRRQADILRRELTKTTQRINLYEKLMIPETRENIRKIKVYLGDQQTAAVCRAKIAKAKLVAKAALAAAATGGA